MASLPSACFASALSVAINHPRSYALQIDHHIGYETRPSPLYRRTNVQFRLVSVLKIPPLLHRQSGYVPSRGPCAVRSVNNVTIGRDSLQHSLHILESVSLIHVLDALVRRDLHDRIDPFSCVKQLNKLLPLMRFIGFVRGNHIHDVQGCELFLHFPDGCWKQVYQLRDVACNLFWY